jgi:hypothetical protein
MLQAIDIAPSRLRNRNRRADLGGSADAQGAGLIGPGMRQMGAVAVLPSNLESVAAPLVLAQLALELGLRVERH